MAKIEQYDEMLAYIDKVHVVLHEPASKGDLLKVYAAISLNQEALLDAMTAMTAMTSNKNLDEALQQFGESFHRANNLATSEIKALINQAVLKGANGE